MKRFFFAALAGAGILFVSSAEAVDLPKLGGEPLHLAVTETSVLGYAFDNRNATHVDDSYLSWVNRLNLQLGWQRWTLSTRLDMATYAFTPDPNVLARRDVAEQGGDLSLGRTRAVQYGKDLSSRYLDTIYPAKLSLSYVAPSFELTFGDFYAQLGRGLVLSVRKIDELALDTTIRGAKTDWRYREHGAQLGVTLLAGESNPSRIDELTGRRLTGPPSLLFAGFPQPFATSYAPDPGPSFYPDRIVGGRVEGGSTEVLLGAQAALVTRQNAPFSTTGDPRAASDIHNASGSLSLPHIGKNAAAYVEVASQQLHGADVTRTGQTGYAAYGSFSAELAPFVLAVEMKHYRRFFPLYAHVDGTTAPEFFLLTYSAPPTTEPIRNDSMFENFNTCTTGGRARLDARASKSVLIYGSVGRYATWAELGDCGVREGTLTDAQRNDVWDPFVGAELLLDGGRSHVFGSSGTRIDRTAIAQNLNAPTPTTDFYTEGWLRYDVLKTLNRSFALQAVGWHRHRHLAPASPWVEGENYLSLLWQTHLTFTFGAEYLTRAGFPSSYFNGAVQWKITSATSIRAFVGQQRGALRCASGVCRIYPPFEGARLELVARF